MSRIAFTTNRRLRTAVPHALSLLILAAIATGPATAAEPAPPLDDPPAVVTDAAIDLEARQAEIEAAERRFNQAARERDRRSFHDLLTQDTVFLAGELHSGRLAVMAIWQHLFDGKYDFRYDAELLEATVARSGELGWAVGSARTSFQRPGMATAEVIDGHYLHLWTRGEGGAWRLSHASTLVVHPSLGAARDPRSGLMTAWPELADQIGAEIEIRWRPDQLVRAESGELAYSFGEYRASFAPPLAAGAEPAAGAESAEGEPASGEELAEGEEPAAGEEPAEGEELTESEEPAEGEDGATVAGKGHFLAVWQKDGAGHWQLAAEGFTPPGIYGAD